MYRSIFIVATFFLLLTVLSPGVSAEILVTGSPVHGSYGMMFDDSDLLHIASLNGNEIVVMDPDTGDILDKLGLDLGVQFPDDLAIGPDGSVYWTDLVANGVGRLTPGGVFTSQYVGPGINPITFSDDGRLFVRADDSSLFEVDPDFIEPPRLIAANIGPINAMDFGPDGLLYFPIPDWNMVVRMDVDSCEGSSDPWNECAMEVLADEFGLLGFPVALKFNSLGELHVVTIPGDVFRVDTATGDKELIATGLPIWVDNLAFDSLDRLFVSHSQNGDIWEILPGGDVRTVSEGGMIMPGGVAVLPGTDTAESVFVADLWSLREFDGQTGEQLSLVNYSFGILTPICSPMTVSPDGGNLVLSSWFNGGGVQVYNPQTGEVLENYPDFPGAFNAIRFMGDLAVADGLTGSVVRASDLVPYAAGLVFPAGLAASDDNLWVGDYATGMVWQIVAGGATLDVPIMVAEGLLGPEGLAVEEPGKLLVVESLAGRLSRIDLATGTVLTLVEGLALGAEGVPLWPPTWQFNGVAKGPSGAIYVTGDIDNLLYKFIPTLEAELTCSPATGMVPYQSDFRVKIKNTTSYARTAAARIDITLAGGLSIPNWKTGTVMVGPGGNFFTRWNQTIPALDQLIGENIFHLVAEDVTSPSGYIASDGVIIEGMN